MTVRPNRYSWIAMNHMDIIRQANEGLQKANDLEQFFEAVRTGGEQLMKMEAQLRNLAAKSIDAMEEGVVQTAVAQLHARLDTLSALFMVANSPETYAKPSVQQALEDLDSGNEETERDLW